MLPNTQELSATSILSLFQTTKAERQSFASQVIDNIKEGHSNPLDIHLQIKCMQELIKQITDSEEYKDMLLTEAQKHGKSFDYHNAKVEVKEVGTKYDYSNCDDPALIELEKWADESNKKLKERQEWLKKMPLEGVDTIHEATGQVTRICPPSKSSTTSIAITLK